MKTLKLNTTSKANIIATTCEVLAAGGLVLFPTETVYGAGVDATNQAAVDKLLAYKSRREGKPLSIAVPDQKSAEKYVELNEQAKTVYMQFLPGPVTVVSRNLGNLAEGVGSEFGTVGVRIPDYPLLLDLLKAYGKPITATSANGSGKKRPYTIADVLENISQKQKNLIDLVLDAGELPKNEPSTVIDTTHATPIALRSGELTEKILGKHGTALQTTRLNSENEVETKALAGKLMLKHWNDVRDSGLTIGLDGKLGAGKTVFAKGVAEFLRIDDVISSPTYSYMEEYPFHRHQTAGMLYHLDLWKIENTAELERLEIHQLLKPKSVVVIEWFNPHQQLLLDMAVQAGAKVIRVRIDEVKPVPYHRELTIFENQ